VVVCVATKLAGEIRIVDVWGLDMISATGSGSPGPINGAN
jgi:hypothetical protein